MRTPLLLLGAMSLAGISCGSDRPVGPTDGTLLIGARTSGEDFDQNGYLISVNGGQGQEIGNLDTLFVNALEPGNYVVNLAGMAENCHVPDETNPRTAAVEAGDTAEVLYDITCDLIEPEPPDGGGL